MEIRKIDKRTAEIIVKGKHYSKRLGILWEAFGLYTENRIIGVCCYGQPSSPIQKHAFRGRNFRLYELTRLVIDADAPKNSASFLIAGSLKLLKEKPCAVVSYADGAWGHCGIVYQASNWLYTGATKAHDSLYVVDGQKLHPMTVRDRFGITNLVEWAKENGIDRVKPDFKHRYFYIVGTKKQRKKMLKQMKYKIINKYPKSDKVSYESLVNCQSLLDIGVL